MTLRATVAAFLVAVLGLLATLCTQQADMNLAYAALCCSPYFILVTLIYFHFHGIREKFNVVDKANFRFEVIYGFLFYLTLTTLLPVLLFFGTIGDDHEHQYYEDLGGAIVDSFPLILTLTIFLALFSSIMKVWSIRSWKILIATFFAGILWVVIVSFISSAIREFKVAEQDRLTKADDIRENRYAWYCAMSNPSAYPVQLYQGTFLLSKDEKYDFTFKDVNYHAEWGQSGIETNKRTMSLPRAIDVIWYSFSEDAFYQLRDTLDYGQLLTLFRQPYTERRASRDFEEHFNSIVLGFAPGGQLVVWAAGTGRSQVEIGCYQAKKVHINKSVSDNGQMNYGDLFNKEWRKNVLTDTAIVPLHMQQAIKVSPVAATYWTKIQKRYRWRPAFVVSPDIKTYDADLRFYNAERSFFDERSRQIPIAERSVPQNCYIKWYDKNNNRCAVNFDFDEDAIFTKFNNFFDTQKQLQVKMEIRIDNNDGKASAYLKSGEHQLLLSEADVIRYGENF